MKNKETLKHSQLPTSLGEIKYITPIDQLVYTTIKFFTNKDTKECFPSITTIQNWTGLGKYAVNNSIERLINSKYMDRTLIKRRYYYTFADYDTFEPFGEEFLRNKELTPTEKAMILAETKFMYKHNKDKTGQITLSNSQLAQKINMPESTISKCNRSLVKKGLLELQTVENSYGHLVQKKIYKLDKLGQAVVFLLNQVKQNTEDIKQTNVRIDFTQELFTKVIEKIPGGKEVLQEVLTEMSI